MELTHGGDWAGYAAQYGGMPLDFSANVSPLGLPQGVRQAVARALDGADRYPDPLCRALRKKLSGTLGVPPQSILCGNALSRGWTYCFCVSRTTPRDAPRPARCFCEF